MPSITLNVTSEKLVIIIAAIEDVLKRIPEETDSDLIKRYIRNKVRTQVLIFQQGQATSDILPDDNILT